MDFSILEYIIYSSIFLTLMMAPIDLGVGHSITHSPQKIADDIKTIRLMGIIMLLLKSMLFSLQFYQDERAFVHMLITIIFVIVVNKYVKRNRWLKSKVFLFVLLIQFIALIIMNYCR